MEIEELRTEWQNLFEAEQELNLQRGKLLQQLRLAFKKEPDWPNNWIRFLKGIGISNNRAYQLMRMASFYFYNQPLSNILPDQND